MPAMMVGQVRDSARLTGMVLHEVTYSLGTRMRPHDHADHALSIVLRGGVRETALGHEQDAGRGSLVVKPARVTHGNVFAPEETRLLNITLTSPEDLDPDGSLVERLWGSYRWHSGRITAAFGLGLHHGLCQGADALSLESQVLELFERMAPPRPSSTAPRWVESVEELVRAQVERPLRLGEIAAVFDVHPVYLARVFRKRYGCSLGEYVKRLRLEKALADLASTQRPIADIALAHGFSDQSHLTRTCQRTLGVSPARYRRWMRG